MTNKKHQFKVALTATPSQLQYAPILWKGDIAAAFRAAAESGCDGVELHLRQAEDVDLFEIKKLMREHHQEVPTLGTGMATGVDGLTFSDPKQDVRHEAVKRVWGHLRLASEIDSAVTIGLIAGKLGAGQRQARRQEALDCLATICLEGERLGVKVLLEPLNRYESDYINTISQALAIVEEIQSPNLRLLADTFHMNIEEADLEKALESAAARLGHIHLSDSNRQAPGNGHLDVGGILQTITKMSYKGYLSLEIFPIPDPESALHNAIQTIQRFSATGEEGESK